MPGRVERPDAARSGVAPARTGTDDQPQVRIEALSNEALGVGHLPGGKVVFVEGALPGETVRVRILKRHRRYDSGEALEILEPSPDRVTPRCPHYGVCGGCRLQHLSTEVQPAARQAWLRDALARIGRLAPERWLPPLAGPGWGYRRRARLGVRHVPGRGGALVGFRERHRSWITPLASCEVLDPKLAALLPALRELITALSRPDRLPQVELAAGENAVALVFRHLEPLTADDLTRLRDFGRDRGVQVHAQPGAPDSIHPLWPEPAADLVYRLPGRPPGPEIELAFGPTDFVQVNADMNRRMVEQALDLLDPGPQDRVLDLFCGQGNFSLPLARRAARVLGIEGEAKLVERARLNARRNRIANAEFLAADLAREGGADPWGPEPFDLWLLDPPRTGALAAVRRLPAAAGPRRILYISCNPATLARDAGLLVHARGYRLSAAGILDMFPQTAHAEAMALFEQDRPGRAPANADAD